MSGKPMSFRHRWVLRAGQERAVSEGARLMGIMAINEFGKANEGAEFWPSHKALAELVGVSERTAERRMNELVQAGLIEKRSGGYQGSNRYVATMPNPDNGDGIVEPANTDSSVGIVEAVNPDNRDANPDRGDGPIPTGVSVEQTQEHTHSEQTHEQPKPPCFEHGVIDCEPCSSGSLHSPTDAAEGEVVGAKHCGCFPGGSCPTCRGNEPQFSNHPEFKLKGWHDHHLEQDEALDPWGEPLDEASQVGRFRGRNRA